MTPAVSRCCSAATQYVFPVPGVQIDAVGRAQGVKIDRHWSIYAYEVTLNTQHEPFRSPQVRRALNYAVNKQAIMTTMWLSNDTEALRVGEAIQQMLGEVGVTVRLTPMEAGTLSPLEYKPVAENQPQMILAAQSPSTGGADWDLRPKYDSESWPPALRNFSFYPDTTPRRVP